MSQSVVPTTIFTGFLGSGKTTLIMPLIEELQGAGQQVAYIKNEIGEVDIDTQLMQGQNITTKELLNGCICCTLVGPFATAVDEIIATIKPSRIIIEASGAADPSAIALMVSAHPRLVRDGVIGVVDVVNFEGYTDLSETARHQAEFVDLLVFNKVEQVDLDRKKTVVGYVRELNQHAPIIEAPQGKLSSSVVFGVAGDELEKLLSDMDLDSHAHHLEHDQLSSVEKTFDQPPSEAELTSYLKQLPGNVYRVKGWVQLSDGRTLLVNKVGQRIDLQPASESLVTQPGRLVLIGFGILDVLQ